MTPKTKTEAVKMAREKALAKLLETGSCAYSTVLALQDTFDLKDEALLKASGALTGGIGGRAETCGAMIGVTLVLGAVCGMGRNDGDNGIPKLYEAVRQAAEFVKWFRTEKGCVSCNQILIMNANGVIYDFTDPEQLQAAMEAGVLDKCREVVQNTTGKAAELLWDELHKSLPGKVKKYA